MWSQHPEIARRWTKEGKGNVVAAGNVPPWMQNKQENGGDGNDKKNARRKAIQERLKKHSKKKDKSKAY